MQSVWMIVAALLFSVMGVAVKLSSAQYGTWEIVAYRGLVGMVVMSGIIAVRAFRGGPSLHEALATRHPRLHLTRDISGTVSLTLWFFAIAGLPLATAMTINYSSPLFIGAWVAWTAFRSGERIDRGMTLALLFGFIGVVLLLQPSFNRDQWMYAIIGVTSTTLTAVAYLSVKALGRAGEPDTRIVFYMSLINALAGFAGALLFGLHAHDPHGIALLLTVGICGALAQLAVTRAFAGGGTLLTANLGYTGIVFSSIWGFVFFGDRVQTTSGFGMAIVVVSGVLATLMTARALRRAASEPDETISSPLPLGAASHAAIDRR
ncbi:MAG: DMT family transporter [Burkholderiaceae bacterium]